MNSRSNIIIISGAGVSADSGIKTFRGSQGLWHNYKVEEVATPEAFAANPELVLSFYNERRKGIATVQPNAAHLALARLEEQFAVKVITQNIDDLHERAGSTDILHLHGKIWEAKSCLDDDLIYDIGYNNIDYGDVCAKGGQLRPNIVWFGEPVPLLEEAAYYCTQADYCIVVGTSLQVYPAACLLSYIPDEAVKFLVDPNPPNTSGIKHLKVIPEKAAVGIPKLVDQLLEGVA